MADDPPRDGRSVIELVPGMRPGAIRWNVLVLLAYLLVLLLLVDLLRTLFGW